MHIFNNCNFNTILNWIDIKTRKDVVRAKGLCRNCLNSRHMASQCLSTGRCRNCGQQHHTLLCEKASAPNDHSNQLNPSVAPFIPIQDEINSGWLYDEIPSNLERMETQIYSFVHNSSEKHNSCYESESDSDSKFSRPQTSTSSLQQDV